MCCKEGHGHSQTKGLKTLKHWGEVEVGSELAFFKFTLSRKRKYFQYSCLEL